MTMNINFPRHQSARSLCKFILLVIACFSISVKAANCSYSVTGEWNTGFQGSVTITNDGKAAINGWSVEWRYTANKITNSWNAVLTGNNPYTAANLEWNKTILPGQAVSFGVQGDKFGGDAEKPIITGGICSGKTSSASSVSNSIASSSKNSEPGSSEKNSSVNNSSIKSSFIKSSSIKSSASVASSIIPGQQCNWYGTRYPVCATTKSGWGYENNKSCVAASTCSAQPSPYGIEGASSSMASTSSIIKSSSSVASSSSVSSLSNSSIKSSTSSTVSKSSLASSMGVIGLISLADFPIGVAVNAGTEANSFITSGTSAQQQAVILPHFNQLTAGNIMKMSYLHPAESTFTFAHADELISFARLHGMKVHGHTLIWHSDYQVPNFMKNYNGDFSAMLKVHVQTIAAHFSGKVASWDVVNEALAEDGDGSAINGYRNSIFYQKMGAAFIDQAFINARAADPVADLFYNDFNIENGGKKTTNLLAMIDGMKLRGAPISGVGFQMHLLSDWPSISTIESVMKAVADRGLKVKITELDVRVNNRYNPSAPVYTSLTAEAAAKQKERYRQVVASYLKVVPAAQRAGITVWGVWDADSWLNIPGEPDWPLLFDANFLPKPALDGFATGLTNK